MKVSIKESTELLVAMGTASALVKKIAKDGINAADLVHLKSIADALPEISEGFKGVSGIYRELKDLDEAEVFELLGTLYAQAEKINEA